MKICEIKKLAKQLLAIVLIVSLVAGMQPSVAKATENTKTITNIAIATPDDKESYTFYNGFNDNWYMLPGTELIVTYSDGSTKKYAVLRPLYTSFKNSKGVTMTGDRWGDYEETSYLSIGEVYESGYASSYYGDRPFEIIFNPDSKKVIAKVGANEFPLYTAQYKDVSEMKTLSTAKTEVINDTRYTKFFRVTGEAGQTYETEIPKISTYDYTELYRYGEKGEYLNFDVQDYQGEAVRLTYNFTEENQSYVIRVGSFSSMYVLHTELCTKEFNKIKEVQILSPKEVFPQFNSCTTDYQLVWEDGTMSPMGSMYATGAFSQDGNKVNFSFQKEGEAATYSLTATDRNGNKQVADFPSETKVSTVSRGNGTNQQEYEVGTKITLKPNETKLLYADLEEGNYVLPYSSYDGLIVQTYSLTRGKREATLPSYYAATLSGEYGMLLSNTSNHTLDFYIVNLSDKKQVSCLQEYVPGTKMILQPNESRLLYSNLEEGKYILYNSNSDGLEVIPYNLQDGTREYLDVYNSSGMSGGYAMLVSNSSNEAKGFCVLNLTDKSQTKNLLEYKPGQEVKMNSGEMAIYRFNASSTYQGERYVSGAIYAYDSTGKRTIIDVKKEYIYEGEIVLVFRTWLDGSKLIFKDKLNPANNVSGPAAKEEWPLPIDEPQKPTNPTTPTNNNSTTNNKPATTTTNTNTSISGKTSTVSKVTFKATSNSAASLTEVKNATTIKSYKVPKTVTIGGKKVKVTTIASNAFKNCKKLKKVTITSNIKTISANAFKNCKKLSTIVIDNAKSLKIKKNAFKGCKKITFKVKKSQMKKFKKMLKKAKIGCKYKVIKK